MKKYKTGDEVMATNEFVPWCLATIVEWDDVAEDYLLKFDYGRIDFCSADSVRDLYPLELALKEK